VSGISGASTVHTREEYWMQQALQQAQQAASAGEVPVGCVVVHNDFCIGTGFNQPISAQDPTAHAEIVALRQAAGHLRNYRLPQATLYVTIEPCTMCVGAMIHARLGTLVFGATEPRAGAVCSHFQLLDTTVYNHRIEYTSGILADQCSQLMTDFFQQRRKPAATKE